MLSMLSLISVVASLQLLGIVLVSMLAGAGLMTLRQRAMSKRLRLFHQKYGAGYMAPNVDALINKAQRIS